MDATAYLRIGELARRSGVSPELLRAWERRYGLLQPSRSPGGFRLYTEEDERRIRRMNEYLAGGLSAAEAARRALAEPAPITATTGVAETAAALVRALEAYDETAAHELLDTALASYGVETMLEEIVAPALRTIGDRWQRGEITVAQEHFASNLLRGRLLGLARGWGRGVGPVALLACPPHEQHDLPLIMVGLTLRAAGWRIAFLGADTPVETLERAVDELEPRAVVISSTIPDHLVSARRELGRLATKARVYVGGPGAEAGLNGRRALVALEPDFRDAADQLSADLQR